ncbi:hypothetical protein C8J56DRAFT_1079682 [Mycena floridula]|nr:hypothetical protein C8J56DRAFT_1079682 [Mycena floridula]
MTFRIDFSTLERSPLYDMFLPTYPVCQFDNPQFPPDSLVPSTIKVLSVIAYGDHSTVCRARVSSEQGSMELALKFGPVHSLAQEADVYDILAEHSPSLLREAVPDFYGMLIETKEKKVGCLILEPWGSQVDKKFWQLSKKDKAQILRKLVDIHAAGIIHCDFEPENILQKDGVFRIVDFGRYHQDHVCPQNPDFDFGGVGENLEVTEEEQLCPNILDIAVDMKLWERGKVLLYDRFVKKADHCLPAQHEISVVPFPRFQYHKVHESRRSQWQLEFYLELRRQLDNGRDLEDFRKEENVAQLVAAAEARTPKYTRKRKTRP